MYLSKDGTCNLRLNNEEGAPTGRTFNEALHASATLRALAMRGGTARSAIADLSALVFVEGTKFVSSSGAAAYDVVGTLKRAIKDSAKSLGVDTANTATAGAAALLAAIGANAAGALAALCVGADGGAALPSPVAPTGMSVEDPDDDCDADDAMLVSSGAQPLRNVSATASTTRPAAARAARAHALRRWLSLREEDAVSSGANAASDAVGRCSALVRSIFDATTRFKRMHAPLPLAATSVLLELFVRDDSRRRGLAGEDDCGEDDNDVDTQLDLTIDAAVAAAAAASPMTALPDDADDAWCVDRKLTVGRARYAFDALLASRGSDSSNRSGGVDGIIDGTDDDVARPDVAKRLLPRGGGGPVPPAAAVTIDPWLKALVDALDAAVKLHDASLPHDGGTSGGGAGGAGDSAAPLPRSVHARLALACGRRGTADDDEGGSIVGGGGGAIETERLEDVTKVTIETERLDTVSFALQVLRLISALLRSAPPSRSDDATTTGNRGNFLRTIQGEQLIVDTTFLKSALNFMSPALSNSMKNTSGSDGGSPLHAIAAPIAPRRALAQLLARLTREEHVAKRVSGSGVVFGKVLVGNCDGALVASLGAAAVRCTRVLAEADEPIGVADDDDELAAVAHGPECLLCARWKASGGGGTGGALPRRCWRALELDETFQVWLHKVESAIGGSESVFDEFKPRAHVARLKVKARQIGTRGDHV